MADKPKDEFAFPSAPSDDPCSWVRGMTLRDYIATAALIGIMSRGERAPSVFSAEEAYETADMMLSVRSSGEES